MENLNRHAIPVEITLSAEGPTMSPDQLGRALERYAIALLAKRHPSDADIGEGELCTDTDGWTCLGRSPDGRLDQDVRTADMVDTANFLLGRHLLIAVPVENEPEPQPEYQQQEPRTL